MCRSEPQMALVVILTMASCGLRILGSGTCSTRTSSLPYQQIAFINLFLLLVLVAARLALNGRDFPGFQYALEPEQIRGQRRVGIFSKQFAKRRGPFAPGRRIDHRKFHHRTAAPWRAGEQNGPGVF